MNKDLMVTVVGWVATNPREVSGERAAFTSFRVGSSSGWFDRERGVWNERPTEWFTVKAFRDVAHNVASSLHKGDPVVVHGRLSTQEWESDGGRRTDLVVEALALGQDLARGRRQFVRTPGGEARSGGPEDRPDAGPDADPWSQEAAELGGRLAAREAGLGSDDGAPDGADAVFAAGSEEEPTGATEDAEEGALATAGRRR